MQLVLLFALGEVKGLTISARPRVASSKRVTACETSYNYDHFVFMTSIAMVNPFLDDVDYQIGLKSNLSLSSDTLRGGNMKFANISFYPILVRQENQKDRNLDGNEI